MNPHVCERACSWHDACHGCEQLDGGHRLREPAVGGRLHRAEHANQSDGERLP